MVYNAVIWIYIGKRSHEPRVFARIPADFFNTFPPEPFNGSLARIHETAGKAQLILSRFFSAHLKQNAFLGADDAPRSGGDVLKELEPARITEKPLLHIYYCWRGAMRTIGKHAYSIAGITLRLKETLSLFLYAITNGHHE
jgi:hypothetical protein